ncbi:hypothetical protein GC105_13950 [Alkalibaculum sp. M08DMB]|uniref:4-oxalocrotonate tautomerase domain-containing protein n=1 Tax=Alkalibaculum sporogenes TaxID=2655001 RepID=A0A6A7KC01_9FIRM|nr:hypothetical protein [Alkalibaculum sporogenes]MPW26885.1 hypothetical protein [Alkalibaculum sporogenes]
MPHISIKTKTSIDRINLEVLNKNISNAMEVDRKKIILSWEIFTENGFYKHGEQNVHYQPLVIIRVSKRNGEEFAKKLAEVVVKELCELLDIPKEGVLLFIHRIELGDVYINGEFV